MKIWEHVCFHCGTRYTANAINGVECPECNDTRVRSLRRVAQAKSAHGPAVFGDLSDRELRSLKTVDGSVAPHTSGPMHSPVLTGGRRQLREILKVHNEQHGTGLVLP